MKKKLVAMLLITAVCGTTLAGCGGGDTDNSAKNKSDSQTSAEPRKWMQTERLMVLCMQKDFQL